MSLLVYITIVIESVSESLRSNEFQRQHEDHHEYTKGSNFSSALPIHFLCSSLIHTSNFKAFTLRLSCRSYAVLEFTTECDFSLFARWPS